MLRDGKSTVPFALMVFLWGSVAAWIHLGLGVTGYEVGVTHDDHKALLTFADRVSNAIDKRERSFDVAFEGSPKSIEAEPTPETKKEEKAKAPKRIAKKEEK